MKSFSFKKSVIYLGEKYLWYIDKLRLVKVHAYLIIVIFFTLTQFLENKIYTEKRQFFALNL